MKRRFFLVAAILFSSVAGATGDLFNSSLNGPVLQNGSVTGGFIVWSPDVGDNSVDVIVAGQGLPDSRVTLKTLYGQILVVNDNWYSATNASAVQCYMNNFVLNPSQFTWNDSIILVRFRLPIGAPTSFLAEMSDTLGRPGQGLLSFTQVQSIPRPYCYFPCGTGACFDCTSGICQPY